MEDDSDRFAGAGNCGIGGNMSSGKFVTIYERMSFSIRMLVSYNTEHAADYCFQYVWKMRICGNKGMIAVPDDKMRMCLLKNDSFALMISGYSDFLCTFVFSKIFCNEKDGFVYFGHGYYRIILRWATDVIRAFVFPGCLGVWYVYCCGRGFGTDCCSVVG